MPQHVLTMVRKCLHPPELLENLGLKDIISAHPMANGSAISVESLLKLKVVLSSITITFAYDESFSISSQIVAHIATIVFAGLLKIGYVLRCVALHGFGKRNF